MPRFIKHGLVGKGIAYRSYQAWLKMRASVKRSLAPGVNAISPEWDDFGAFFKDMGRRPDGSYMIYRRDETLPFGPGNCEWMLVMDVHALKKPQNSDQYREIYALWNNVRSRVWPSYRCPGLKAMDPRWQDFRVFAEDMGDKPDDANMLMRLDDTKPFGPGNCIWTTRKKFDPIKQERIKNEHNKLAGVAGTPAGSNRKRPVYQGWG